MISIPHEYRILVVDDEPDIHAVTRLSLKSIRYRERRVTIDTASSGREAVEYVRQHPDIAVILLDVVMESQTAGLDACRAIREELGNRFVRILLRTGQPGVAPERKTIDEYDIDGYLAKAELTSHRLYASVRTALKAFEELVELERHREILKFVHECALEMHAFEPLEDSLRRVLTAAGAIASASLTMLQLQTVTEDGCPRQILLHVGSDAALAGEDDAVALATRIAAAAGEAGPGTHRAVEAGLVVPIVLHRDMGHGWLYVRSAVDDPLTLQALNLLTSHAANALYSTVAIRILKAQEQVPLFDEMSI